MNKGTAPTFVTRNRSEVLDITLPTNTIPNKLSNGHVSTDNSLSDYREICFHLNCADVPLQKFCNPRNTDWPKLQESVSQNVLILRRYWHWMYWYCLDLSLVSLDLSWQESLLGVEKLLPGQTPNIDDFQLKPKQLMENWCAQALFKPERRVSHSPIIQYSYNLITKHAYKKRLNWNHLDKCTAFIIDVNGSKNYHAEIKICRKQNGHNRLFSIGFQL